MVSSLLHLYDFNLFKGFFVCQETVELGLDLSKGRVKHLFALCCLSELLLHLGHFLVKLNSPTDFFEDAKETILTLSHELLHLALLDNLELGVAAQGKPATFEQVEQFFLPDWLPIDAVVLLVGLAVVALSHDEVVSFDWDLSPNIL